MRPPDILIQGTEYYDRWNNIPHYTQIRNMEEGLVSPHWLVTTRITPSFPFSKTNLQTSILSLTQNTNAYQNR